MKRLFRDLLRSGFVQRALGVLAAEYLRLVWYTNRFIYQPHDVYGIVEPLMPAIFVFWHGQHFMTPFIKTKDSYRAKVQRLPIEAISQASANQRKGRCGRVEPGICVRLYSEEDFLGRPEFTDPEILRTNLAAVILQMLHLRLGEITAFPFIEPPDGKAISDGFNLLQELSAVDRNSQLTPLGRQLARLPVDPRMGRMLLHFVI